MEDPKAASLFHPTRALLDSLELDQMILSFDESPIEFQFQIKHNKEG